MSELTVNVDLAKCLTQRGFVDHLNDIFNFPGDFWNSVNVVDDHMQDFSWIPEDTINVTLTNLNKAKKNPNDGPNHGLKWAIDRFDMYKNYWDFPRASKIFNIHVKG